MKKSLPWVAIYVEDYDNDTFHLTCEQDGAYWRLLRRCWKQGWLPDDDLALASICGVTKLYWIRHLAPAVRPFFESKVPGRLTQKRLEEERENARIISEKRAENARKRHQQNRQNSGPVFNENNDVGSAFASDLQEQMQEQSRTHTQTHTQDSESALHTTESVSARDSVVVEIRADDEPKPKFRNTSRYDVPALSDPMQKWVLWAQSRSLPGIIFRDDTVTGAKRVLVKRPDFQIEVPNEVDLKATCEMICKAAQINRPNWRGDWDTVVKWIAVEGHDRERDILPAISANVEYRSKIGKYTQPDWLTAFTNKIVDFVERRKAA